jgi:hypothetical protein
VSGEDEGAIQKVFVDQLGAKYPLVKIKAGDKAPYGIKFYPSVYVIDPDGNVFSTPEERMPSEQQIEELLQRATLAPKMPADARYDPLRALWKKREFVKVRDYLDKNLAAPNLDAAMKDVFTAQRAEFDKRQQGAMKRIESLGAGPDYAAAEDQLESIEKQWKGLEPSTAAAAARARFSADPAIKKELAASRALQKLLASFDMSKSSAKKKLIPELEKFAKKHEGTHAGKQAASKLAALNGSG